VSHPAYLPAGTVPCALAPRVSGRKAKLTTHVHLVPRSMIRGALHPGLLYSFMA